ncbi:hypothetical protein ABPG72_011499 [Tetrahymena utriculariae]
MKRLLLIATLALVASCQLVYECPEDGKVFKCSSEPLEVCGIKTVNGEQIKETFANSCQACSAGKVEFTIERKCEDYLEEAQFYTPSDKKIQECDDQIEPKCAWFDQDVKCLVYPCAINAKNKCSSCQVKNVLYTTEGKCSKSIQFHQMIKNE